MLATITLALGFIKVTIQVQWNNLLIDVVIAKNQQWIQNGRQGVAIDKIDSILVSGLLIRAVSILDESLIVYINTNKVLIPGKKPKLYHRLLALDKAGLLQDYSDIDRWRNRRNDVGHKISDIYTWGELDECLHSIYRELSHLCIITHFPVLAVKKTTQRVRPTKSGVSIEQEVTIIIHDENDVDNIYYQFGWRVCCGR